MNPESSPRGSAGRPPPRAHAHFDLPPLSTGEALLLIDLLDRALNAIWDIHGEAIEDLDDTPRPPGADWDHESPDGDQEIPF